MVLNELSERNENKSEQNKPYSIMCNWWCMEARKTHIETSRHIY